MTLGEGKNRAYQLLDEYSIGGSVQIDEDIRRKMNSLFDTAQRSLCGIRKIIRAVPLENPEAAGKYLRYRMPPDFRAPERLWRDGEPAGCGGLWQGDSLLLPASLGGEWAMEYSAYPTEITDETPDEYEFELPRDAQDCLPYFAAANTLCVDIVVDSGRIQNQYDRLVQALEQPTAGVARVVTRR